MVKRKDIGGQGSQNGSISSDEDTDMLDVDFEWFDPQEIDFHGIKQLLKQLLDADNELFDLSALSDLIISQPLLGSTVKVPDDEHEAKENDPFALLTVLNLHTHRERPEVKTLASYLANKAQSTAALSPVSSLLKDTSANTQIGLVLSERFINMPPDISPPMYKMLLEEIAWAVGENEPYNFTHYLVLSKSYTEIASLLPGMDEDNDNGAGPPAKKKKKAKSGPAGGAETFYFHPEDEIFMRHAVAKGEFSYSKEADPNSSDAKRAFQEAGIKPLGVMMLIDASKFEQAVKDVEAYVAGGVVAG